MTLLNAGILKPETETAISEIGPRAEQIADRWLGGWEKRTLELEANGDLLPRLQQQTETEASVISGARMSGQMSHMADHEIADLYDLNEGPP